MKSNHPHRCRRQPTQTIANNRKSIFAWLKRLPADTVIGMEATGHFHHLLADGAALRGHTVYVINPKHLADYAQGVGQRGKTDPLDAKVIARDVDRERDHLHPYLVPTTLQRTLRTLLSQRAAVIRHTGAINQNLHSTMANGGASLNLARHQTLGAWPRWLPPLRPNSIAPLPRRQHSKQSAHRYKRLPALAF
ncbi:MAG: transposase [Burkholderiales bacterium]